jgi:hypothetical protein
MTIENTNTNQTDTTADADTSSSQEAKPESKGKTFTVSDKDNTYLKDAKAAACLGLKVGVFVGSALLVIGLANAAVSHMMPDQAPSA